MIGWLLVLAVALAEPLALDDVLAVVDARVPQLRGAAARIDEREGDVLAGRGAFDPTIGGSMWGYTATTPYERYAADAYVEVATPLGPRVQAGWRIGQGAFPAYDGYYETIDVGRARVQIATPLLEGLGLGAERARVLIAERRVDEAARTVDVERLALRQRAAASWWRWVGAGERLAIARRLEEVANARQEALQRQVELGTLARLDALDHERVVQRRLADRLDAEQRVEVAARHLSLWYRDPGGEPVVPATEALPPLPDALPPLPPGDPVERALALRPELQVLEALLAQVEIEQRRAVNERLPRLDVLGRVEQSPEDATRAEVFVGARLEVPLLQRQGRGAQQRAEAATTRLAAEQRALRDAIRVDVEAAALQREAADARADALRVAAERAEATLRLEQRAFDLGTSDLFRVLVREQTYAEAVGEAIDARVAAGIADVGWRAATGVLGE